MPTDLKITDIDIKEFECGKSDDFTIIGEGFTKKVTVKLEETRYKADHEWIPLEQYCGSDASSESDEDGTHIRMHAKPRKKDGSKCGDRSTGDLTITVTNHESSGTTAASGTEKFDVIYFS
jgi:hypothetical protein